MLHIIIYTVAICATTLMMAHYTLHILVEGSMCDFVSGWVGGCCGLILGHPFDTLKVRQQALGNKR